LQDHITFEKHGNHPIPPQD